MFHDNMAMDPNEKMIKATLVRNLKKYRAKLKITQEVAAERADLTLNYWQRLEMISQKVLPSVPTLFKLAQVLNCKPKDLLE